MCCLCLSHLSPLPLKFKAHTNTNSMRAKCFVLLWESETHVYRPLGRLLLRVMAQRKGEEQGEALNRAFHPVCDREAGRKWTQEWRQLEGRKCRQMVGWGQEKGGNQGGVWTGSGRARGDGAVKEEWPECCSLAHIWWMFSATTGFNH